MLQLNSTVHGHITKKLSSQNSTFETTPFLKQLPLNTFAIHTKFIPVKISNIPKFLCLGPFKLIQHLPYVTFELMAQDGSTFQTHRSQFGHTILKSHMSVNIILLPHFLPILTLTLIKTISLIHLNKILTHLLNFLIHKLLLKPLRNNKQIYALFPSSYS